MTTLRSLVLASGLVLSGFALAQTVGRALSLTLNGSPQTARAIVVDGQTYVPVSSLAPLGVRAEVSGATVALSSSGGGPRSTFDAGDDGWTVVGDAQGGGVRPDVSPRGGRTGGFVSAKDDVAGGTWYWRAPAAYRGNRTSFYGGQLAFSLRQSSLERQFDDPDVMLRGGDVTLVLALPRHPGLNWTPYTVGLDERAGWRVGSLTGPAASAAQLRAVLGRLDDLKIRGEYVEGADTGGLDDVSLGRVDCPTP